MRMRHGIGFLAVLLAMGSSNAAPQKEKIPSKDLAEFLTWAQPVKPYRIIGNVYYVGANELTSYLITTPQGHILIDAGMEEMVPQIEKNIETLGFRVRDVKILLNTQAHIDHAAGFAALKRTTGAKLMISRGDVPVIESGGAKDFLWPDRFGWEPAKVDEFVEDREKIVLGGVVLTAHLTPGHTKGCTTYTMTVREEGKNYHVLFLGSTSQVGAKLIGNEKYPQIADDYQKTFQVLRELSCDVFLASHGSFYDSLKKAERLARGEKPNPFVDPQGFRAFLDRQETLFRAELKQAQTAKGN
jgi:metallo-beta-lactamase class B